MIKHVCEKDICEAVKSILLRNVVKIPRFSIRTSETFRTVCPSASTSFLVEFYWFWELVREVFFEPCAILGFPYVEEMKSRTAALAYFDANSYAN